MTRSLLERIGYPAALTLALVFNFLANAVPLGGQTTGDISDKYDSLFTPEGFTFAIWGVIYTALTVFVIWQMLPRQRSQSTLSRMWPLFALNCVANAGWIVAWHYDMLIVSMAVMLVILSTLYRLNEQIDAEAEWSRGLTYWAAVLPLQIYFGWISVATIANISILQSAYGLNDWLMGESVWTLIKLTAAASLGIVWGLMKSRPAYLAVIAWAAFGISVANAGPGSVGVAAKILQYIAWAGATWVVILRFRPNRTS